jgi:DNA-binding response OmpR family regulator
VPGPSRIKGEVTCPDKVPLRILVVDDEQVIVEIIRRVLDGEECEVDVSTDGKTAQHMFMDIQYDLCILDVKMPEISGSDFYHWLEEKQPNLAKWVIFTTGDGVSEGTASFLEESGRPFLPKPFSPEALKNLVKQVMSKYQSAIRN